MELETESWTAKQTEEFDYLFHTLSVELPFNQTYHANDNEKVRFHTGLPSYNIL